MVYSSKWILFRQAEEDYFNRRYEFFQDNEALVEDLKKALSSPHDRETALRVLGQIHPNISILMTLLAKVLDTAIDSSNLTSIGLARAVLVNYQAEAWVRSNIPLLVTRYLADQDEWHYRRIAELYSLLAYQEELSDLLLLCRASANVEVREISEDYRTQE